MIVVIEKGLTFKLNKIFVQQFFKWIIVSDRTDLLAKNSFKIIYYLLGLGHAY